MATIDAAAVTRITGVPIGTLNVWVQRGLVPGVEVGKKGIAREFDLDRVLHIAATVTLVQLGYPASFASMAAAAARNGFEKLGAKLVIGPPRRGAYGLTGTPTIDYVEAETPEDLDAWLDRFVDGRPTGYTVIELDSLAARVRKAFGEPDLAERSRRQRGTPARQSVRRQR